MVKVLVPAHWRSTLLEAMLNAVLFVCVLVIIANRVVATKDALSKRKAVKERYWDVLHALHSHGDDGITAYYLEHGEGFKPKNAQAVLDVAVISGHADMFYFYGGDGPGIRTFRINNYGTYAILQREAEARTALSEQDTKPLG